MNLKQVNSKLLTDTLSKKVLLPGESKKDLCKISSELESDLKPHGALEEILCSKIISDTWKLRRLYSFESQVYREQQLDRNRNTDTTFQFKNQKRFRSTIKQISHSSVIDEIQKQISVVENGLLKTVSELTTLQKIRLQNK